MENVPLSKRPAYIEFRDRVLADVEKKGEVQYSIEYLREIARIIGCSSSELIGLFTSTNRVIMEPRDDIQGVYRVTLNNGS